MTYRLIETEAWARSKTVLNANAKVSLRYALERIEDDPHGLYRRHRREDGSMVDYGAEHLLISYQILEPDRVRLLDAVDLKDAHRW